MGDGEMDLSLNGEDSDDRVDKSNYFKGGAGSLADM